MAVGVMLLISIIDIYLHKIPNKLVVALAMVIAPRFHLHLLFIVITVAIFLFTQLGAGDLKYAIIASLYPVHIESTTTMAICAISAAISLLLWRREGYVPLAPTISAVILFNS